MGEKEGGEGGEEKSGMWDDAVKNERSTFKKAGGGSKSQVEKNLGNEEIGGMERGQGNETGTFGLGAGASKRRKTENGCPLSGEGKERRRGGG